MAEDCGGRRQKVRALLDRGTHRIHDHGNAMHMEVALDGIADPPETASERVVVLMAPSEKRSLVGRARHRGMNVSEFVRRAIDRYDPDAEEEAAQLAALCAELHASNAAAADALDRAEAAVKRALSGGEGAS
jgi:Arc/MetJ-type ribon-helix-helix transcriptional regulator